MNKIIGWFKNPCVISIISVLGGLIFFHLLSCVISRAAIRKEIEMERRVPSGIYYWNRTVCEWQYDNKKLIFDLAIPDEVNDLKLRKEK